MVAPTIVLRYLLMLAVANGIFFFWYHSFSQLPDDSTATDDLTSPYPAPEQPEDTQHQDKVTTTLSK